MLLSILNHNDLFPHLWFLSHYRPTVDSFFQSPDIRPGIHPKLSHNDSQFSLAVLDVDRLTEVEFRDGEWIANPHQPEADYIVFGEKTSDLLFEWVYYAHKNSKGPRP